MQQYQERWNIYAFDTSSFGRKENLCHIVGDERATELLASVSKKKDTDEAVGNAPTKARAQKQDKVFTDRAKLYFEKAINKGFMEKTESGYKWMFNGGKKAGLAYFLSKVYIPNGYGDIPLTELEKLFDVIYLKQCLYGLNNTKNTKKWIAKIDTIF